MEDLVEARVENTEARYARVWEERGRAEFQSFLTQSLCPAPFGPTFTATSSFLPKSVNGDTNIPPTPTPASIIQGARCMQAAFCLDFIPLTPIALHQGRGRIYSGCGRFNACNY